MRAPVRHVRFSLVVAIGRLVLSAPALAAFPYTLQWSRTFDNPAHDDDLSYGLGVDHADNVVFLATMHWPTSSGDWLILRYDSAGQDAGSVTYNSPASNIDEPVNVAFDSANNMMVAGTEERADLGQSVNWRVNQYSPTLVPGWTATYDGPVSGYDTPFGIAVDSFDDVIVAGQSEGPSPNPWFDWYGQVYDPTGAPAGSFSYDGPASGLDICRGVAEDSLDRVTAVGKIDDGGSTGLDWGIRQYDNTGTLLWSQSFSGTVVGGEDMAVDVKTDSADNVIVTGFYTVAGQGFDIMTQKYDSGGTLLWSRTHDGPLHTDDIPEHVAIGKSDEVAVCGIENWNGVENSVVLVYDSGGGLLWSLTYAGAAAGGRPNRATGIGFDSANNLLIGRNVDRSDLGQGRDLLVEKWGPAAPPASGLAAAVAVIPSAPAACQNFMVAVTITNTGASTVNALALDGITPNVSGLAALVGGPVPPIPASLGAGSATTCIWTYQGPAGPVIFSTTASGFDTGLAATIASPLAVSPPTVIAPAGAPTVPIAVTTTRYDYSSGEVAVYTIAYTNTSADTAYNLSIADTVTPGVAIVSAPGSTGTAATVKWNLPPLPPGGAGTVSLAVKVPFVPGGAFICGGPDLDSAEADYTDACGSVQPPTGGSSLPILYHNAAVSLAVQSSATAVAQGSPLTYTIIAVNTCDDSALNVQIWDTLPADDTYVGMPALPGGGYASGNRRVSFLPFALSRSGLTGSVYAVSFTVSATGSGAAMWPETASAAYANEAGFAQPTALSASVCVAVLAPHLKVTVTGPPEAGTDATFTYTITVSNATGSATAYSVVLVDTVPGGLGFVAGSNGASLTGRVVTWLLPDIPAGGSAVVTASMHGPGGEQELTVADAAHVTSMSGGGLVQQDDPDDHGTWTVTLQPVLVVRVFPTPFEPAAAIRGTLKFSGLNPGATVKIFTVSGALVRSLAGVTTHRLEWDGRDSGGAPAAAGIYFYLLTNPDAAGGADKVSKGTFGVIR